MKNIILLLLMPAFLRCQSLPDSLTRKIDNVFRAYHDKTPGCAVAIMKNDQVVFQKGYGMANLEYSIPITPNTIFHIASESKQFVAFCILLLEKEGKLKVEDDIRKYLDYVPDFGHTITIHQLISHTSGLRDQWQLLANAGWQLDDVITQEHVIKLVSKQKALNFIPGSEHLYCNTGYTLLAEIIKKVSGQTLRQYADKNIFKPLGMSQTHFNDDYQEIVPNRAYSYFSPFPGTYRNAVLSYSIVGATSLLTTVLDEMKWEENYYTAAVGGKELIEKMHVVGVLNDGRKLNYAYALNIEQFKGWKIIGHGGGDAGFRTYACRIPEKGLSFVVFSNDGSANPNGLVREVADLMIPDSREEQKPKATAAYADSSIYKKLRGNYYSERGRLGEFTWENGKLKSRNFGIPSSSDLKLSVSGKNRYAIGETGSFLILNDKNIFPDSVTEFEIESPTNRIVFKRQPGDAPLQPKDFIGRYYDDETEAFYNVTEKDGKLMLEHRKYSTVPLRKIAPDQFNCDNWWMSNICFIRDAQGKVIAFEVNAGRIFHLRYDKMN